MVPVERGMTETKTVTKWKELRKPFPKEAVGLLPKPYKKDSPKGKCSDCKGYHGLPAVHLDYVGHAAVTDRLLEVDPEWNWVPLAIDERGMPALDSDRNLWIKLTVLGVTRLGVGDGSNMKELIGDAIRNAAMRFGVALDLWSKEELESTLDDPSAKNEKKSNPATPQDHVKTAFPDAEVTYATKTMPISQKNLIYRLGERMGYSKEALDGRIAALTGPDETTAFIEKLEAEVEKKGAES